MSHAKIGRFSKKQIFELPDGTHRLEPHLYVRVRGNGRYRNYFFRYLDPKGRVCDLALGSASKKPLSEVKQFAFLLKTSLQFSGKASALMEAKQHPVLFKDCTASHRNLSLGSTMEKSGSKAVLEFLYKHLCLSRHWGKIHR